MNMHLGFHFRRHMAKPSSVLVHASPSGPLTPLAFSWHWWYVVMAITGAISMAVLMAVYVAKLRRKETRFGYVGCCCSSQMELKGGTRKVCQTKCLSCF